MKYGTLSLVFVLLTVSCAASLPEKPAAPTLVIAVEPVHAERAPDDQDLEDQAVSISRSTNGTAFAASPAQETEYAFACQSFDQRNGWRSGIVTIHEPWDQPAGSLIPIPVLDFDVLADEAKQRFEARRDALTGQPVSPRTVCLFQGLTMKNQTPMWP